MSGKTPRKRFGGCHVSIEIVNAGAAYKFKKALEELLALHEEQPWLGLHPIIRKLSEAYEDLDGKIEKGPQDRGSDCDESNAAG